MPDIQVVSRERHAGKRWMRYASYAFAGSEAVAPLVIQELPKACMVMPLGFVAVDDGFMPVAVQGLTPGMNLLVGTDGCWLAGYVPAAYRSYPFALANTADGQQVLTVVEDSGLLSDTEGELFFEENNEPAQAVKDVLGFLEQVSVNRQATRRACAALQKHNLIKPWPINLDTEAGRQAVEGLYTLDEAALNQAPADVLHELRDAGALLVAYCQLLSIQHMQKLVALFRAHAAQNAANLETPSGELDIEFLNDSDTINFGALR